MAQHQGDVFTAAQAIAHGYTSRQVRRRLTTGHWHTVAGRGLTAHPPSGTDDRWSALALAWAAHLTWPDAVIGYHVAASLHGFPLDSGPDVHVLLPVRRAPGRGLVAHHVPFRRSDVALLPGDLPVTSPVRTAVDCLAVLDPDQAWPLFAWLVTRRRLDRALFTDHLQRRFGRPGTRQLRALHAQTTSGAVSPPEHRLHHLLHEAGLVGWRAGARVTDQHGLIGVVDILFDQAKLVIEIDGFGPHTTPTAFVADRRRQNRLINAGYQVLRFTWWDLTAEPERVLREIRDAVIRNS